jgi:hypothetical protein
LWQAGGEIDAIEMGLAADAPDGLHMNTIHMLSPSTRSQTIIATGLVLDTWPVQSKGTGPRSSKP